MTTPSRCWIALAFLTLPPNALAQDLPAMGVADVGLSNAGAEASVSGLFNRLRLGYRFNPWCDRGIKKRAVVIGLSDFNGLAYWVARLMR